MLKVNVTNHPFHGEIETLAGTDLTMSTMWVEGIEIVAFVCVIYVLFFSMNRALSLVAPKTSKLQKKEQRSTVPGGMVGAHIRRQE